MPTFRRFTADVSGAAPRAPRASVSAFGGETAAALQALGQQGQRLSQELGDLHERRDKMKAHQEAAAIRERATAKLDELEQKGEPVTDQFSDYISAELEEFKNARETAGGIDIAKRFSSRLQAEMLHAARERDAALAGKEAQNAADEMMQSNSTFLQSNPDTLPEILDENRSFVDSLPADIQPAAKKEILREMNEVAARNAAQGWIRLDPDTAKEMIEEGHFDDHIGGETRRVLLSRADTRIRSRREQQRAERAEFERQKQITSQTTMNDALIRAHSEDPEERLTAPEVASLAEQMHEDGEPILSPGQVNTLFGIVQRAASEGNPETSSSAALEVIPNLGTISQDRLIQLYSEGEISKTDFERWMRETSQGDSALRSLRKRTFDNAPTNAGISPHLAPYNDDLGDMMLKLERTVREREQEYRDAGKNPMDYYTDGTAAKDALEIARDVGAIDEEKAIMQRLEVLADGREPVEGMERGKRIEYPMGSGQFRLYLGGDPENIENYVRAEEIQ